MKIASILPYKENYTQQGAGAVALWISDFMRDSIFKKDTFVFGNTKNNNFLTKNYINIDANAKLKLAKYITFKNDKKLDVNDIETEWAKLTSSEQQAYLDGAPTTAQTLTKQGVLQYSVDKDTYNKVLEVQ